MAHLQTVLTTLDTLAPLRYAAKWDNVGLLVEPPQMPEVLAAHLTIDLTEAVYDEARAAGAQLIVAYHPPIFGGLKRLTMAAPITRTVLRAAADGVAVYAPHTALDAVCGGVNDWLIEGLGPIDARAAIEPIEDERAPEPWLGMGRTGRLRTPLGTAAVVARLKAHLGLPAIRVAWAARHAAGAPIERVAVCPGAGGSLFEGVRGVDLLVTGEMRHHDVLARVAGGTSVVLTDHTNTERGFLPVYAEQLRAACPGLVVTVSAVDADPMVVV
jgi:dinuclear metal center YbgI/SA1388 family protein